MTSDPNRTGASEREVRAIAETFHEALEPLLTKEEFRAEMGALRSEMRGEWASLRGEMRGEWASFRAELRRALWIQTFVIVGSVAAILAVFLLLPA